MSTNQPAVPALPQAPQEYTGAWGTLLQARFNQVVSRVNNVSTVTLTASAGTTTLTDPRLGAYTVITFMPQTAHAAAVVASIYVTAQAKGTATINHTNDANVDKTFGIAFHG